MLRLSWYWSVPNRVLGSIRTPARNYGLPDGVKSLCVPECGRAQRNRLRDRAADRTRWRSAPAGAATSTATHVLWQQKKGSNAGSPVFHDGYLYWASENGGVLHCQDVATGKEAYTQRLTPDAGRIWASPVLADRPKLLLRLAV